MEELTEVQKIKLGDFKAQLASILSNISVANKELEATYDSTRKARAESVAAKKENESVLKELTKRKTEVETLLSKLDTGTKELDKEKSSFLVYKTYEENKINEERESLYNRNQELERNRIILLKEIEELRKEKDVKEKEINEEKERKALLEKSIDDLQDKIGSKERMISLLEEEAERIIHSNAVLVQNGKEAIAELEARAKELGEYLEEPRKALEEREARQTLREKQFAVIKFRTEKMFNKLYPGQTIDKLI